MLGKIAISVSMLAGAGLIRHEIIEKQLSRELREQEILPEPIDLELSEALGQTASTVALGGLRSLVAAMLNYSRVVPAWENQDWTKIFTTFESIHALQPKVAYYWEAAAGYAADDAYSDYKDRAGYSPERRALMQQTMFDRGVMYLDDGMRFLPLEPRLSAKKARIYSDRFKPAQIDYAKAASILDETIQLPGASPVLQRTRFYTMARVPERQLEAYQLALELQAKGQNFPSVLCILFALHNQYNTNDLSSNFTQKTFGDDESAFRALFNYFQRRHESYPMTGVREELKRILALKNPPSDLDPFVNEDIVRYTLNLVDFLSICPLSLPADIHAQGSDWPAIIQFHQTYGQDSLPTVRVLMFVLQELSQVPPEEHLSIQQIFPNDRIAFRDFYNYYQDRNKGYPMVGVREELERLAASLRLPPHLNPLNESTSWYFLDRDWMMALDSLQLQER